jgi:pimeloyl-ACP methyl ester carboxylesterase
VESKFIEAGGVRMRWEERGEGRPVVFVHGIPTSPRLWRRVIPKVNGARCLAWEMVGYGASIPEGEMRDISVTRQVGYLADWMREVGLGGGAVIVGHDLGGGVAQILAVRYPELVRGLVLANCICYDNWPIFPVKAIRASGSALARLPYPVFRFVYAGGSCSGCTTIGEWRESRSRSTGPTTRGRRRAPQRSSGRHARSTTETRWRSRTASRSSTCRRAWSGARPTDSWR